MTFAEATQTLGLARLDGQTVLSVYSVHAERLELLLYAEADAVEPEQVLPLERHDGGVWTVRTPLLQPGRHYALRADGPDQPGNAFDADAALLDPYARGIHQAADGSWRSVVVDEGFDWDGVAKPGTALDRTVIYEAHVAGLTRLSPEVPEALRGSYAGLAHEAAIERLRELGITAIELLPVHAFASEPFLLERGLSNYWGYNTLSFFSPHPGYASAEARAQGADAVLREFKGMVKQLHAAGIEVLLDVVYNHTAEGGHGGETTSFRGLDNRSYYRLDEEGRPLNFSGTGNTLDASDPGVQRLILDSLRYWAQEVQIDGFRFDLATVLGRNERGDFDPEHPLLSAIGRDPLLAGTKLIAEPWDVGPDGWQTGRFPAGWSEWNDRYRDRMRDFWLRDIAEARISGTAGSGIGRFAGRFAGSAHTFPAERGPLASVNFITAHDGFTLHDLVSYNVKHNLLNGEAGRDGSGNNLSFNHGAEGATTDESILRTRRRAMRNLLGTLLLSSGVPMLTAGDEFGRSQGGNNNAYCQDNETTWLPAALEPWQERLLQTTRTLIRLRRENPALRPRRYARFGETVPGASQMDWYDATGQTMSAEDWNSPENRTLQYLAASTPEFEPFNRILVIVHALEDDALVRLPWHEGVSGYRLLWDSAVEDETDDGRDDAAASAGDADAAAAPLAPGATLRVAGTSMRLYLALGDAAEAHRDAEADAR